MRETRQTIQNQKQKILCGRLLKKKRRNDTAVRWLSGDSFPATLSQIAEKGTLSNSTWITTVTVKVNFWGRPCFTLPLHSFQLEIVDWLLMRFAIHQNFFNLSSVRSILVQYPVVHTSKAFPFASTLSFYFSKLGCCRLEGHDIIDISYRLHFGWNSSI